MKIDRNKPALIAFGVTVIAVASSPAQAASLYSVTELPFLPFDLNDRGQIVGEQYLWDNSKLTDLGTLPGANDSPIAATAINNEGTIVGTGLKVGTFNAQAFKSNGLTISPLPLPTFCTSFCSGTSAEDINDRGAIALNYDGRIGTILQPDGSVTTLTPRARGLSSIAINNSGQVTQSLIYTGSGITGAFNQGDTTYRLGRTTNGGNYDSRTADLNDRAQVVGSSLPDSNSFYNQATLWSDPQGDANGTFLGTLGGQFSTADGINNKDQVVGTSQMSDRKTNHAFLWEDGQLFDLNQLIGDDSGWELTSAFEINDRGQIIGIGSNNGQERGFLLSVAVPEPSSVLGLAVFGVLGLAWRFKRV